MASKASKRYKPAATPTRFGKLRHARHAPILLLEAAGREFGKKGFEGASFREIANAAGLSFALIGYHFGSKEELWNSCIDYFATKGKDALLTTRQEMPASRKAFGEWLREFLGTGLLIAIEDPVLWRMSMHAALSNAKSYYDFILPSIIQDFIKNLEKTFARANKVITRFTPQEAQFIYRAIIHMHVSAPHELALVTGHAYSTAESLEYQVEFLVSLLCNGKGIESRPRGGTSRRKKPSLPQTATAANRLRDESSLRLADGRLSKGEKVRERLIEAALKNFALFGFEGTSVRMIAKDAKVTYPLVIYHFGSKELLWHAAIEQIFRERIDRARALTTNFEVNNASQLREVISLLLAGAAARPELRKIFVLEFLADSGRYEETLKPMGAEFAAALLSLTQRLADKKIVSRFSPSEVQLLIVSMALYNAVVPEVVNIVLGTKTTEQSIDWIADFLVSLLTKGRGLR